MGRCLGILGIIVGLVIIGIAVVVIIVFSTDNKFADDFIADTFCEENETLIRETHTTTTSDGEGTSYTFYCDDNQTGEQREITTPVTVAGIGSFALNLCCGILIVIGASMLLTGSVARQKLSEIQQFNQQFGNMGQQGGATFQMPNSMNVTFTQESYTAQEVEERLRRLQEMLNNGTLSQEQYFSIERELRSRQR